MLPQATQVRGECAESPKATLLRGVAVLAATWSVPVYGRATQDGERMKVDRRQANRDWYAADETGECPTWERVQLAVLMDLRDELQAMRQLAMSGDLCRVRIVLERKRQRVAPRKRKKGR